MRKESTTQDLGARATQVSTEMNNLRHEIEELEALPGDVETRLESILSPPKLSEEDMEDVVEEICSHAKQLRCCARRVESVRREIAQLMNRIEL